MTKHLTGYTTYKAQLPRRNAKGEYSSIRPVIFLILLALVILFLTLNALLNAPLNSPRPETGCFVSQVPQTQAFEPLPQNKALYDTVKNDPIRREIYMRFGEINTEVAVQALAIAQCESTMNASVKNKNSSASGVFQIINGTFTGYKCVGNVFDANDNIACAVKIYKSNHSWKQWSCGKILGI